jgi:putative transcriptional regulator
MSQIKTTQSLQNHFLIAMPVLNDGYFARSVAFIVEHNIDGAMGIVINQPSTMSFREMIKIADNKISLTDDLSEKIVVCGGPVHPDRGFILHTSKPGYASSINVSSDIMVTTSKDILSEIGNQTGPEKSVVALGFAGWDAGQLEEEIKENVWLTVEADDMLLFETPIHQKWQAAVNKLGIDVWQLTQQAGRA